MKIETKFDIGQQVYYLIGLFDSDIRFGEILGIEYYGKAIIYEIEYNRNLHEEKFVFATKAEAEQKLKEMKGEKQRN
ncbi:MAG: hypothetical protein SPK94_07900 [Bacteroidales bacterium]|nr:hypothetical protein [Bacteroidales bacterium]